MMSINRNKTMIMAALALSTATILGQQAMAAEMTGMDHMQHGAAPAAPMNEMGAMDHSKMGHEQPAAKSKKMEMQPAAGTSQQPMSMQGGDAPANARDPHAYADGYDFGPIPPPKMADVGDMGGVLFNRFETTTLRGSSPVMYDVQGWLGKDYDKLVVKAEGKVKSGKLQDARTELLWGHAVATYWDTQLGVRNDSGVAPNRNWLAFGVQGIAPYWFAVDAAAYLGERGRTAVRLSTEYEVLFTQKWILQPRAEANFFGQQDAARELGSGLSSMVAGLRLRYEIRREFAPYIGVEWNGKFGGTANFARVAGAKVNNTRVVAGLRFWF
jgi:copper resistance protein B